MLDPISLGAIGAVLGAVGMGMANEAGRWAWESAGGLVRRIAGREVAAPAGAGDLDEVARLVHQRVHADPELARAWSRFAARVPQPGGSADRAPVSCLPHAPRFFTDRQEALKLLDKEAARPFEGRPRLALLHGPEGIGTSTLAVHWGWRNTTRFPDGQLYADLRTLAPEAAPARLLRQLGVPEQEIPPAAEDRAELVRRQLAGRRLLLVLDHARSAAQVGPLLTSAPDVFTVVVARQPLTGLDALRVPVGPLARRDAERLLTDLVGRPAMSAARAGLPAVLDRCAGSPYALRAAAPRLTAPVGGVPAGAEALRAAADDSYRALAPDAARLYRLAALRPWPALDPAAAARAADVDEETATRLLEELTGALLLDHVDTGRHRYRPGVRAHAERLAATVDGIAACSAAVSRTVDHYVRLAVGAARAALPESWRVPPELPDQAVFADRGRAVAALTAEAQNLVQAVAAAEEFGDRDTVTLLCRALWPLQLKAGQHEILLPALRTGARVADERLPGSRTAAALHAQLAHTLTELRRWDEAEREAVAAADAERTAGHVRGHASAVEFLGLLRLRQWRFTEAYDRFEEASRVLDAIGPGDECAADLPRARALLLRHRGRALRGLGRWTEAVEHLEGALRFFRETGEAYNAARTLTDLAETRLDAGERQLALPLAEEALGALEREKAEYQVRYLRGLRERCLGDG
ncbi:tetratricopeptide repeat protein [Streptomyces sp. NPDC088387]|uniref:tetratricopeptide repeat protein n=1 Tax=Streptomyces sp. NPDC088387 TaxID=3365859 RepID=UPI0037FCBA94